MIFSNAPLIESEKERNLCTKFFAGYFFNEFTPGYTKRITLFNRYIQEVTGREDLALQSPNVSFDTHAYLCHERLRSKLADVLVSDPARQVFLFIETKYLSNWTYAADVAKGLERLDKVFDTEKKPHLADARQHYFVLTSRRSRRPPRAPLRARECAYFCAVAHSACRRGGSREHRACKALIHQLAVLGGSGADV